MTPSNCSVIVGEAAVGVVLVSVGEVGVSSPHPAANRTHRHARHRQFIATHFDEQRRHADGARMKLQ
jgi:hypothetical protein